MNSTRPLVIAVGLILGGQLAFAQDMSRYRAYVLQSSLESVVAASGARTADAKTLHERPATIQQIVNIDIPHPRDISSPRYLELRDGIFKQIGLAHKL